MEKQESQKGELFDAYTRRIEDQELKGILLKLKNEMRRSNASWESIRVVLSSLWDKRKEALIEILPFILK